MLEEYNKCMRCGKPIKTGRPDKKFCSPGCKNLFHNKLKILEHKEIQKVDLILKRNRRILMRLFNPKKEEVLVARDVLLKHGFDFSFHTHMIVTKKYQHEFIFCYDYGYRETEKDRYRIIKGF